MPALLVPELLPILLICSLAPGLLLVSRLRLAPLEKLCSAFAASFITTYLVSFALFLLNAPPSAYWTATAIFLCMGLAGRRTLRLFLDHCAARKILTLFALLLAWDFLHLALVRNFAGGDWSGDWQEHYQRTQYFLHQLTPDFLYLGQYPLPARPPMMNLMAAFVCRQTGLNFQAYSLCFLFWNAWTFLPCCLILRRFAPRRTPFTALAILFMLNPSITEHSTLTVTKALTAALVLLGLALYLRRRVALGGTSLAAAILVHYSAGPCAAAIGLHYLWQVARRRAPVPQAIRAATASAALLIPWFVYSIALFGLKLTFNSNAMTVGIAQDSFSQNILRMLYNMYTNIVPHPFHSIDDPLWHRVTNLGGLRDYYFLIVQTTLPFMIGLVSGPLVIFLLIRQIFSSSCPSCSSWIHRFWIFFIPFTFVVGTAVNIDWKPHGTANITLQPLALLGVIYLASQLHCLKKPLFVALVCGLAIDYALGILLHFNRLSYTYPIIRYPNGRIEIRPDYTLGKGVGWGEFVAKLQAGYVFWGDVFSPAAPMLQTASAIIAAAAIVELIKLQKKSSNRLD